MTPALAAAKAHNVETSGAPPRFAPHGFFSAHNPTAEAANTADHTPTTSVGAMSDAATVPRRRFVRLRGALWVRPARFLCTTSRVVSFLARDAPVATRTRSIVVVDMTVCSRDACAFRVVGLWRVRVSNRKSSLARTHSFHEQCRASNRRHRKRASSRASSPVSSSPPCRSRSRRFARGNRRSRKRGIIRTQRMRRETRGCPWRRRGKGDGDGDGDGGMVRPMWGRRRIDGVDAGSLEICRSYVHVLALQRTSTVCDWKR